MALPLQGGLDSRLVVDVTGGTRMRFVLAERSARRPDTSATHRRNCSGCKCTSIGDSILKKFAQIIAYY